MFVIVHPKSYLVSVLNLTFQKNNVHLIQLIQNIWLNANKIN